MARSTPGNYVPLDVNYLRDSAIREAGPDAELLYIRALAFVKGSRTDGLIPRYDLPVVGVGLKRLQQRAAALVAHDLWVECPEGWLIRSWHRWNDAAAAESLAGEIAAHTRWHTNLGKVNPDCEQCQKALADAAPDATGNAIALPPQMPPVMQGKGREVKERTSSSATADALFAEFWREYPRKVGKQDAEKVFHRQRRRTDPELIVAGARRLASDPNLPEPQFIPHASTWLVRGGWEDEPYPAPEGQSQGSGWQLPDPPAGMEVGGPEWQAWRLEQQNARRSA